MKHCTKCGAALADGVAFCSSCGQPVDNQTVGSIASSPAQTTAGVARESIGVSSAQQSKLDFCVKCGARIAPEAGFCSSCGTPRMQVAQPLGGSIAVGTKVDNHLTKAILTTLFCCLPLGIASIVYAQQVNSKLQAGDVNGAIEASNKADTYANWSIGAGIVVGVLYLLVNLAG